jgi:hypothetical protein
LVIVLGLCGLQTVATAQRGVAVNSRGPDPCASGNPSAVLTLHAAQSGARYLNLCDGHMLAATLAPAGHAQPLSLASADFDQDGVPDLVSGYAVAKGGSKGASLSSVR